MRVDTANPIDRLIATIKAATVPPGQPSPAAGGNFETSLPAGPGGGADTINRGGRTLRAMILGVDTLGDTDVYLAVGGRSIDYGY